MSGLPDIPMSSLADIPMSGRPDMNQESIIRKIKPPPLPPTRRCGLNRRRIAMKKESGPGAALKLPTAEEPLPEFLGTPGLQLLRLLIREVWRSDRLRLTPGQEALVREIADAAGRAMKPAKPAEIGRLLEALMLHYPVVKRTPEEAQSIAADWLRDLGHLPLDIVDAACTAWRRGQNAYAPTPGHLLALAEPILIARRHLHSMAVKILAPEGTGAEARNIPPAGSVKAAAGVR